MKAFRIAAAAIVLALTFAAGIGYDRWRHSSAGQATTTAEAHRYYCPMHPDYRSDRPGTCPICGMALVPIDATEPPTDAGTDSAAGASDMPPPGSIRVSADKQQLIGVTYGHVEERRDTRTIRAVGTIAIDDTRVTRVHPRVEGWIERVYADEIGRIVSTGQPLVSIFSPDMLTRQQEFLLALRTSEAQAVDAAMREQNDRIVAAARRRLELFDLTPAQIDQVAASGTPMKAVLVDAPATGVVLTRNAYPRQRVTIETELYTIADLRRLWVRADVFEHEAAFIRPGQPATVTITATGRTVEARVALLAPSVDPATRALQVRLDIPNPGLVLRPDMFVEVAFPVRESTRLTVPIAAVLDSGLRKTVFVDRGNGFLEPREVRTGVLVGERIEILGGLVAGDRIVTSGTFLLDSESQLKLGPSGTPAAPAATPPAGHDHAPPRPDGGSTGGRP